MDDFRESNSFQVAEGVVVGVMQKEYVTKKAEKDWERCETHRLDDNAKLPRDTFSIR